MNALVFGVLRISPLRFSRRTVALHSLQVARTIKVFPPSVLDGPSYLTKVDIPTEGYDPGGQGYEPGGQGYDPIHEVDHGRFYP